MQITGQVNVLYIHGMGGGGASRIPGILRSYFSGRLFSPETPGTEGAFYVNVVVRTYDFDPDKAWEQISAWLDELKPALVIGESLGANNALRIRSVVPHIFVSPSLNAPLYLGYLAPLALIPGVRALLERIYKPSSGDRQRMDFRFCTLRKYRRLRRIALDGAGVRGDDLECDIQRQPASALCVWAFFGTHDHFRRSGIVSIRTWRRHFGKSRHTIYDGTHFMEEEYVTSLLVPKMLEFLGLM